MGIRPRINKNINTTTEVKPNFEPNCASENAKFLHKYTEFEVELWIDKHYEKRLLYGDDNGKREGINVGNVQELIINAFKYLLEIYLRFPRFTFINFFE